MSGCLIKKKYVSKRKAVVDVFSWKGILKLCWTHFVIFKPLSYFFEETIVFDVKASFASRLVSRLIRWYNKPGDITKEFFSSTRLFMNWKLQTELQQPNTFFKDNTGQQSAIFSRHFRRQRQFFIIVSKLLQNWRHAESTLKTPWRWLQWSWLL